MSNTQQTSVSVESLFRPFPWGSSSLRNRIVMAPMTRSQSPGKVPGDDVAAYYRRRAEGGTGLIITEGRTPTTRRPPRTRTCPASTTRPVWQGGRRWSTACTRRAAPSFRNCGTAGRTASPAPSATSDSTASSCTAPTAISSISSSGNTGKPTITVGSVGLDLEFLRQLSGETAHSARLDALLERLDNGEFDLVAVGRALLGDSAWANKIRDGRENEIVTFTPEHAATLT